MAGRLILLLDCDSAAYVIGRGTHGDWYVTLDVYKGLSEIADLSSCLTDSVFLLGIDLLYRRNPAFFEVKNLAILQGSDYRMACLVRGFSKIFANVRDIL